MSKLSQSVMALAVSSLFASAFAAPGTGPQAGPASGPWHVVLTDSRESIALDTSRVLRTSSGTSAWSRIAVR